MKCTQKYFRGSWKCASSLISLILSILIKVSRMNFTFISTKFLFAKKESALAEVFHINLDAEMTKL